MDYTAIFEISGSGMDFHKLRLEAIAANMANANVTRPSNGVLYRPLEAVAATAGFNELVNDVEPSAWGVKDMQLVERQVSPRMVFDPSHPDANAEGFIELPNINPIDEMTNLMMATRAYEANVRVLNAAKTMALRALEIGGK